MTCKSCRWWERSGNHKSIAKDWGLCHLWGGKAGHRISSGFIDYSFGHEPLGSDQCQHWNCHPDKKPEVQLSGAKPEMKCEGKIVSRRTKLPPGATP